MFYDREYNLYGYKLAIAFDIFDDETKLLGFSLTKSGEKLAGQPYSTPDEGDWVKFSGTLFDFNGNELVLPTFQRGACIKCLEPGADGLSTVMRYTICAMYERELCGEAEERITKCLNEISDVKDQIKPTVPVFKFLREQTYILTDNKLFLSRDGKPFKDVSDTGTGVICIKNRTFPFLYAPELNEE